MKNKELNLMKENYNELNWMCMTANEYKQDLIQYDHQKMNI